MKKALTRMYPVDGMFTSKIYNFSSLKVGWSISLKQHFYG